MGLLDVSEDALAPICRRHRIRKLSLFGSRLKGTARPDSDVDLRTAQDLSHYFRDEVVRTAEAAQSAINFMSGRERADLNQDRMLRFAVTRAIEIVGGAASKISDETRSAHDGIPLESHRRHAQPFGSRLFRYQRRPSQHPG